jgi:hypothetical protein
MAFTQFPPKAYRSGIIMAVSHTSLRGVKTPSGSGGADAVINFGQR